MRAPRGIAIVGAGSVALCLAFALTGPWTIGALSLRYWSHIFGVCGLALAATAVDRSARAYWREWFRSEWRLQPRAVAILFVVAFAFLLNICLRRYAAFQVNAWDLSISFDHPIEQTLHGNLLWSDTQRMSMLGVHCNWLLLAFVPLYAIVASPYWLLIAQPLAIAGAMAVLFFYARRALDDDMAAICVAFAFLFNRYTVRVVNLGFVIDVFYPLAMLLLLYAFRQKRAWLGVAATIALLAIKEDAILPLAGFAIVIAIRYRAWRWAALTATAAMAVFAADYSYVIPAFRQGPMPFAIWWGTFGPTPVRAMLGMLVHPIDVVRRVIPPAFMLLSSMAFLPLIGGDWMLAAIPTIVAYTSADVDDFHWLALHYSLPILGLLFAAAADGLARVSVRWRRAVALLLLAVSLSVGSGYRMERPRPERTAIPRLLTAAGARPVFVQGALFPHAGYDANYLVLHHDVNVPRNGAYLLCSSCAPYPFTREEFAARFEALQRSARYRAVREADLWLFVPRD